MVKFLPYSLVVVADIALVCFHDIHHHLGILLLFVLGHSSIGKHPLPIFWQARKLSSLVVVTHMNHVHRVFWRRDLDGSRRTKYAVHETRETTLLSLCQRLDDLAGEALGAHRTVWVRWGDIHDLTARRNRLYTLKLVLAQIGTCM